MTEPWQCTVCKERFTSAFKGSIHVRAMHPSGSVVYTADGPRVSRCIDPELDAWGNVRVAGGPDWVGE